MKSKYHILFIVVGLISTTSLFSQTETKHPIDIQCEACLDSTENQSTFGMVDCERKAENAWNVEMTKYFTLLLGILDKTEQGKLKSAQKTWLNYKKTEINFFQTSYTNEGGTMWQIFAAARTTSLVKARVLDLIYYYDLLTYKE